MAMRMSHGARLIVLAVGCVWLVISDKLSQVTLHTCHICGLWLFVPTSLAYCISTRFTVYTVYAEHLVLSFRLLHDSLIRPFRF